MITPNNQDSSGIVFDAKSGISEEEQREILAKINNIAEKNRLSLLEDKNTRFKAKKSGRVFPVIVNIIALAALAGGLFMLTSMQGKTDAQIRTGAKVYNSAERALIEEIRKQTQNEAMGLASDELERLSMEQSQAAAVENQMGAFFANLNRQITDNKLDEAGGTIRAMRNFINTPAFEAVRSIQARKGLYVQAINSFETMINETRKYQAALNSDNAFSDLQTKIGELEQDLKEKDNMINSQGSSAARQLNDLRKRYADLEKVNGNLQTRYADLEKINGNLQTRYADLATDLDRQKNAVETLQKTLDQTKKDLSDRDSTIKERDDTIASQKTTITNREEAIKKIRTEVELDRDYDDIPPSEIKAHIAKIQNALKSVTQ